MKILRPIALLGALVAISVGAMSTTASSAKMAPASPPPAKAVQAPSDVERATALLESYQATYRYLDDVTVSEGPTPEGEQAVSYYTDGQIVLDPDHSATTEAIMAHEIWHVIDYRDNGKIDWGESIPPENTADYLK